MRGSPRRRSPPVGSPTVQTSQLLRDQSRLGAAPDEGLALLHGRCIEKLQHDGMKIGLVAATEIRVAEHLAVDER